VDDRTWRLSLYMLGASVLVVFIDAAMTEFAVPPGFWVAMGSIAGLAGARSVFRDKGDDGPDRE
jgi:hypothetical protein